MEKSCRKCSSKASPRLHVYFGKQPETATACKKLFLKIRYFERRLSKNIWKVWKGRGKITKI